MHFYRALNSIQALTFDLDDTLYDNSPFMIKAVDEMMITITQVDGLQDLQLNEFNKIKHDVLIEQPDIYHDVIAWRIATIQTLLRLKGIKDQSQLNQITDDSMNSFIFWRNKVVVPQDSYDILAALAEKYPLAVITNGNADIDKIGLQDYFQFSLRGGADGLSKPFADMFTLAAKQLNLAAKNILHVGDNLITDVQGAINSGMQACWINIADIDIYQQAEASVLPHVEIKQLSELKNLL